MTDPVLSEPAERPDDAVRPDPDPKPDTGPQPDGTARLVLTAEDGDVIALTTQRPVPLTSRVWTVDALIERDGVAATPPGADHAAYLVFGTDGMVKGSLGCNRFSGTAKVSGTTVSFGRLSATRKLCPGPRMTLERRVQRVLDGTVGYEVSHRSLLLLTPDGSGVAASTGLNSGQS